MIEGRTFLQFPRAKDIWRESRNTLVQFFRNAIPIFFLITIIASILDWLNIIDRLGRVTGPLMAIFRLPASAALPVLLASIRKDGILLFAQQDGIATLSSVQLITGVYLAGVLLPCLVTILTICREVSLRFALKLLARQATFAVLFSIVLAWASSIWE
jgi:Fe2+ transport system protein B